MVQTVILHGESQRRHARELVEKAPAGSVVRVSAPRRTIPQNDRMWAMLSDVSRSKPEGRMHTPEVWKALFMHACGHAVQFEMGLSGEPFPVGFRSSRLTVEEMGELMEFISAWGSERGVMWTEPERQDDA